MRYFATVLPQLAEARLDVDLFWEIKANLNRDHVRALRDAGVRGSSRASRAWLTRCSS